MYQSSEIKAKLTRVIEYLAQQTYSEYMDGTPSVKSITSFQYPTIGGWFNSLGEARKIIQNARHEVAKPVPVIIVVDLDAVERRLVAASIPDEKVIGLLPYQAGVGVGSHYFHIVNSSEYDVRTNAHVIPYGEALCGRGINSGESFVGEQVYVGVGQHKVIPTCPGCLAKAKNQIAFHLQQNTLV